MPSCATSPPATAKAGSGPTMRASGHAPSAGWIGRRPCCNPTSLSACSGDFTELPSICGIGPPSATRSRAAPDISNCWTRCSRTGRIWAATHSLWPTFPPARRSIAISSWRSSGRRFRTWRLGTAGCRTVLPIANTSWCRSASCAGASIIDAASHRVEPAEPDRVALAGKQRGHLVERQPHHVAVGADHLDDEAAGDALGGIAAGLAAPFAGGEIGLDVLLGQALEAHAGLDQALAEGLVRRHQADPGMDPVIAPGQEPQALRGLVEQLGLRQYAAADRHDRVGGEDIGATELLIDAHLLERGFRLGARQPVGAGARQLTALRRLVEIGRAQRVGLDAGLIDQRDPAGRAGGEDEFGPADHFIATKLRLPSLPGMTNIIHLNR